MEKEDVASISSAPATPGTPGAPLFGGFEGERDGLGNGRRSFLRSPCRCFGVEEWAMEEGRLPPVSCAISFLVPPPVSLARKVV